MKFKDTNIFCNIYFVKENKEKKKKQKKWIKYNVNNDNNNKDKSRLDMVSSNCLVSINN